MGNEDYIDEDLLAELSDDVLEPDISSFDMSSAEDKVSENTGFNKDIDDLSSDEAFSRISVSAYSQTDSKEDKAVDKISDSEEGEDKTDGNKTDEGKSSSSDINKTHKDKADEDKTCENENKTSKDGVKYAGCDDSVDEFIKREAEKNEKENSKKNKKDSGNKKKFDEAKEGDKGFQKNNQAESNTEKTDPSGFSEDMEGEAGTTTEFNIYSDSESKTVVDDPYLYYMSNYKKAEEMCAACHYKNNFHSCGECKSKQEADYYKKAYEEAVSKDNAAGKKNSPKDKALKEGSSKEPKDVEADENSVLSVFSNPDVKKVGIYIASVAAIILSLVLISCFTKSSSKAENVQNEKFVKNSESISEKNNTVMYSNAATITDILFSGDEVYENAYSEAYGSIGDITSSRFETLDDLTFYLDSNFSSILADEKLLITKFKNEEISQKEFMNEMNSYISEADSLNHLLISNRETYNLEGKSSEYDSLSEKADTVIMYGDSAVYINCK